jgi:hypothetical protein
MEYEYFIALVNQSVKNPPNVAIKTILEYYWGLTLHLSYDKKQNQLGQMLNKNTLLILDSHNAEFSRDLKMTLSKTIRSIAFVRDAHVKYMNYKFQDLGRHKRVLDRVSQLLSFKESGLSLQIITFFIFRFNSSNISFSYKSH